MEIRLSEPLQHQPLAEKILLKKYQKLFLSMSKIHPPTLNKLVHCHVLLHILPMDLVCSYLPLRLLLQLLLLKENQYLLLEELRLGLNPQFQQNQQYRYAY